jgi:hypothetical protein
MSKFRCPNCRKQTFGVNEIGRPFPKRLREVQIRMRCIYCGAILAQQGGEWTFPRQLAPLVISAFLFAVLIYHLPDIALFKVLEIAVQGLLAYKVASV